MILEVETIGTCQTVRWLDLTCFAHGITDCAESEIEECSGWTISCAATSIIESLESGTEWIAGIVIPQRC